MVSPPTWNEDHALLFLQKQGALGGRKLRGHNHRGSPPQSTTWKSNQRSTYTAFGACLNLGICQQFRKLHLYYTYPSRQRGVSSSVRNARRRTVADQPDPSQLHGFRLALRLPNPQWERRPDTLASFAMASSASGPLTLTPARPRSEPPRHVASWERHATRPTSRFFLRSGGYSWDDFLSITHRPPMSLGRTNEILAVIQQHCLSQLLPMSVADVD